MPSQMGCRSSCHCTRCWRLLWLDVAGIGGAFVRLLIFVLLALLVESSFSACWCCCRGLHLVTALKPVGRGHS